MRPLTIARVFAHVRPDGGVGPFEPRRFELMLDSTAALDAQQREALRIMRQLGWQPRGGARIEPRDLRQEA